MRFDAEFSENFVVLSRFEIPILRVLVPIVVTSEFRKENKMRQMSAGTARKNVLEAVGPNNTRKQDIRLLPHCFKHALAC